MSNRICKCGHGEDEHDAINDSYNDLACFHFDESTSGYCPCMAFQENIDAELSRLREVEANYDALQTPMPCGHLGRYAIDGADGTGFCVYCAALAAEEENDILRGTVE